jgi:pimeloyl-ACP methyl ester carboxylesterase
MTGSTIRLPGDGLSLAADSYGDPENPPVLFFHGGGQSRRSWRGAARRVAEAGYHGLAIDLRGHGESDWAADGAYHVTDYARDVEALIAHFARPLALVGASRGGQSALIGSSRHPEHVALLMLADVAPHINDAGVEGVRRFFRASDAGFSSLEDAADVLSVHLGQPRPDDISGLARALRTNDDGRMFWQWDSRAGAPEFLNPPTEGEALIDAARLLKMPVVLVKAEHSDVVSDDSVARFRALTPQLEVAVAMGVGHMFTGDRNDAFADTLIAHLARHLPVIS